ncbi:MAG TPA: hypothetical protein VHT29_03050 [Solirubrobacteraceae bacterium]|nr:hypothetical protein [Solirubrobacteraceae bacterium]
MSSPRPDDEAELIELIRAVDVRAPDRLRARTEAIIAERSSRSRPGRRSLNPRLGAPLALAAIAAIVLVLVLTGTGSAPSQRLSVSTAAALALRPATMSAPRESPHARTELAATIDGIAFPYWGERFGWSSSGAREDRLGGRTVRTVFYSDGRGQRVGYAIVAGTPAPSVAGGVVRWRGGTPYRLLQQDGARVVVWLRDGHLCVVGARGVSDATLLRLASWDERPAAA